MLRLSAPMFKRTVKIILITFAFLVVGVLAISEASPQDVGYVPLSPRQPSSTRLVSFDATSTITFTPVFTVWLPLVRRQYPPGLIAFVSDRDSRNEEIYTIKVDGTELRNLTNNLQRSDRYPAWSPDGDKIAFASYANGDYGIFVMNPDGTGTIRLTDNIVWGYSLAWSPNGTKIVFDALHSGNPEIYVMNADGTELTNLSNNPARDSCPSWSPDGTRIAFWSERDGNSEVYIVNVDGTGLTNLTKNSALDTLSDLVTAWSPDGAKLVFNSFRDGNFEVYVMNADGTQPTNLTQRLGWDDNPTWSPDGSKIAFVAFSDDHRSVGISVMNSDGTGMTQLTLASDLTLHTLPVWSPDGSQIAFEAYQDAQWEVYVMNADGSGLRNLTNNQFFDYFSAWQP